MMTYSEFEIRFLMALAEATDATDRRTCEALQVAQTVLPQVKEQWVHDAVNSYEQKGYLDPAISRPLDGQVILSVSGEARKAVESLEAQISETQKPKSRIGF